MFCLISFSYTPTFSPWSLPKTQSVENHKADPEAITMKGASLTERTTHAHILLFSEHVPQYSPLSLFCLLFQGYQP